MCTLTLQSTLSILCKMAGPFCPNFGKLAGLLPVLQQLCFILHLSFKCGHIPELSQSSPQSPFTAQKTKDGTHIFQCQTMLVCCLICIYPGRQAWCYCLLHMTLPCCILDCFLIRFLNCNYLLNSWWISLKFAPCTYLYVIFMTDTLFIQLTLCFKFMFCGS